MGYSTNMGTLEAQLDNLKLLREGQACVWTVDHALVSQFAYKIREALWIARNVPQAAERYPELARAYEQFKIVVSGPGKVEAQPKQSRLISVSPLPVGSTSHGGELAGQTRSMMGPQTANSIIQTWLDTQPSNDKYYFPQANLGPDELRKLHSWASVKGLLFFESDGAITLTRKTRDLEDVAWSPDDLVDGGLDG